jgi:hypothetical protein
MSAVIFVFVSNGCCITRKKKDEEEETFVTHLSADHAQCDLKLDRDWTTVTIHVFHISHWWKMEKSYC